MYPPDNAIIWRSKYEMTLVGSYIIKVMLSKAFCCQQCYHEKKKSWRRFTLLLVKNPEMLSFSHFFGQFLKHFPWMERQSGVCYLQLVIKRSFKSTQNWCFTSTSTILTAKAACSAMHLMSKDLSLCIFWGWRRKSLVSSTADSLFRICYSDFLKLSSYTSLICQSWWLDLIDTV